MSKIYNSYQILNFFARVNLYNCNRMRQRVLDDFAIPIYPQDFESRNMCFDVWITVANLQKFSLVFVLLLFEVYHSNDTC